MEVIVFSEGDANTTDTWSNIPFFLTKYLEKHNVVVHRVDVGIRSSRFPIRLLALFIDCYYRIRAKICPSNRVYSLKRTLFYQRIVEYKIKKAVKRFSDAECLISTTFSFSGADFSNSKTCMICDWTIEYLIEVMQERKPGKLESKCIKRQNIEISKVDCVITLFPAVQKYMEVKNQRKIFYLGHVINSDLINYDMEKLIHRKYVGNRFLFIGGKKYIISANNLVQAILQYNKTHETKMYVDIIGLNKSDILIEENPYVNFHGYLSKSKENEKILYYKLVFGAKAIVNTTEKWGGASSIVEAMYYVTPAILVANDDIVQMFGKKENFGLYCNSNTSEDVYKCIERMNRFSENDYRSLCMCANEIVGTFSWDNYIERLLQILNNKTMEN